MLCGKRAVLAENVDVFGQSSLGIVSQVSAQKRGTNLGHRGRNHFVTDDADVFVGVVAKFGRDDVGAEKGGDDGALPRLRSSLDGFERLKFAGEVEAIAGFGFDGGGALGGHFVERA